MTVFERACMPSQGGATGWLNSEPLGPPSHGAALDRGKSRRA